jgi:CRP/FNR family cyclic AMP-dependent transcriptional regulator
MQAGHREGLRPASRVRSAQRTDWFNDLPAALQARITARMTQRRFEAGTTIYHEGDDGDVMYRIVSGRVRIRSLSACGKEVLMVVYGPGHCVGAVSVLDGLPRHNDAIAQCDVVLDALPADDYHELAREEPVLYKALAISYTMWIRDLHTMFVGGLPLEERLARRLDFMLDFGVTRSDDRAQGALRIEMTQEMLAASVAVSRQAISRVLQDWQESGVIDYRYGSVVVLDRPRLRQLAGKSLA